MNKKLLLASIILPLALGEMSAEQKQMRVWLNNGESYTYPIEEVDSVSFSEQEQPAYTVSDENTIPPTLSSPRPLALTEEQLTFVKGNNEFGKKCLDLIATNKSENYCFSPVNLNIALGMCANTAWDTGVKEIADAMGIKTKDQLADMNQYFSEMCQSLNTPVDSVVIKITNAFWLDYGMKNLTKQEFVETLRNQYFSTIRCLDFRHNPQGAKDTINKWAEVMTNGRIKKISADIDDSTKAVINNATYFKGKWIPKFQETGDEKFHLSETSSKDVPMIMAYEEGMGYYQNDDYEAVSVSFGNQGSFPGQKSGQSYSMAFLLPNEGKTLGDVLPDIHWEEIPFKQQYGTLKMPKFDFKGNYKLVSVLDSLGIKSIFSNCSKGFLRNDIFVSDVTQDTYIKVDEKGAEAAAVTTIVMAAGAARTNSFEMTIDRPYAFAIREDKTGLLLFIGIVNDPTYKGKKE